MALQVRKASRKKAKLRLGIAAPSGAGKTMGALLLAYGITSDWEKIGFIDTETGSGELYVGSEVDGVTIGEYAYVRIEPDYTANKYIEAIHALEKYGAEVIIVDSLSHAWSGIGGLLEKQGIVADRTKNSYTAWREVTPDHNRLVDALLQSKAHIICTMRSKQEYVLETNEKGKQVPKKVGMAPVQREGMEYEFTVMLDIDMSHVATSSKDRTRLFDGRYFKINTKTGEQLLGWLNSGGDAAAEEPKEVTSIALKAAPDGKPHRINIGILDNGHSDWMQWVKDFGAAIRSAKNGEEFEQWLAENQQPLGGLKKICEETENKLYSRVMALIDQLAPKNQTIEQQLEAAE